MAILIASLFHLPIIIASVIKACSRVLLSNDPTMLHSTVRNSPDELGIRIERANFSNTVRRCLEPFLWHCDNAFVSFISSKWNLDQVQGFSLVVQPENVQLLLRTATASTASNEASRDWPLEHHWACLTCNSTLTWNDQSSSIWISSVSPESFLERQGSVSTHIVKHPYQRAFHLSSEVVRYHHYDPEKGK